MKSSFAEVVGDVTAPPNPPPAGVVLSTMVSTSFPLLPTVRERCSVSAVRLPHLRPIYPSFVALGPRHAARWVATALTSRIPLLITCQVGISPYRLPTLRGTSWLRYDHVFFYGHDDLMLLQQCWFCRQGGHVLVCHRCRSTAGCISFNGVPGCFPPCREWTCPACYQEQRLPLPVCALSILSDLADDGRPQYAVPIPTAGVSPEGMSITPLALYNVFLDDGQTFNVHQVSSASLTGMIRSRFIGRVSVSPSAYGRPDVRALGGWPTPPRARIS